MGYKHERATGQDSGISCDRAWELFYDFADGELSSEDEHLLSLHETSCPNCGAEFREWRRLRSALRDSRVTPATGFKARVMARIQEIQAVPEPTRIVRWSKIWQQGWTKGVAAAAVVLVLMAGAAKLPATISLIALLDQKSHIVVPVPGPVPIVAQNPSPGPISPDGTPANNGNPVKPHNPDNINPVKPPIPSVTPGGKPMIAINDTGERVFLANQKRVITTTTMKVTVNNIDQARSDALSIARNFKAELSSETPTQNSGHSTLFQRFTIDPGTGSARAFLDQLGSVGSVVTKHTESEDVTNQFARTLEAYRALKAQQSAAPEADKQQYASQISGLELELQNWDDTSGKQVVMLWLEQ